MDETVYTTRASSRRRRRRRARQRRAVLLAAALAVAGVLVWHFFPRPYYTARQLGITQIQSPLDANGDGVDDYTDMLFGARDYIATKPVLQERLLRRRLPQRRKRRLHGRHLAGAQGRRVQSQGSRRPRYSRRALRLSERRRARPKHRLPPRDKPRRLSPPPRTGADVQSRRSRAVAAGRHRRFRRHGSHRHLLRPAQSAAVSPFSSTTATPSTAPSSTTTCGKCLSPDTTAGTAAGSDGAKPEENFSITQV